MSAYHSPCYNESHHRLRKEVCVLVDTKINPINPINPEAHAYALNGKEASAQAKRDMAGSKFNRMRLGPGKHLRGLTLMRGIKGEGLRRHLEQSSQSPSSRHPQPAADLPRPLGPLVNPRSATLAAHAPLPLSYTCDAVLQVLERRDVKHWRQLSN